MEKKKERHLTLSWSRLRLWKVFRNATKTKKMQSLFTITSQAIQKTAKSSRGSSPSPSSLSKGRPRVAATHGWRCCSPFCATLFLPGLKSNTIRNTSVESHCPSQLNTCSHQWPDKATKTCCCVCPQPGACVLLKPTSRLEAMELPSYGHSCHTSGPSSVFYLDAHASCIPDI